MRKFAIGLVMVVGQIGFASGLEHLMLEKTSKPLHEGSGGVEVVRVFRDGLVQGVRAGKVTEIGRVTRSQIRRIDQMIEDMQEHDLDYRPEFCEAISTLDESYTALDGTIVIQTQRSPCGGVTLRNNAAARELVELLDGFHHDLVS